MKLKRLIKGINFTEIKGSKEIEITGICSNSQLVVPGNLFIARKGNTYDGNLFITQAVKSGAIAIVTDLFDPTLKNVTQLIHKNIASIEADLAATYYSVPSNNLFMVGVTGTNGKTTTSFLVRHILNDVFPSCGLLGTIEYIIGNHRYQSTHTTPDAITNQKFLKEMINEGCKSAVMEVSSHGLEQNRLQNIHFDIAIYTNLSHEHLDYHKGMEEYAKAKQKLFKSLQKSSKKHPVSVINIDCPWSEKMVVGGAILSYGIEKEADVRATNIVLSSSVNTFDLNYQGKLYKVKSNFVGKFNVYNVLAAICVGIIAKISMERILQLVETFPFVPGRLQPVPNDLNLNIFVDYAHADDPLKNVLETLNELKKGKIITVFGCGGDRDKGKRPKMAKVCESYSDYTIITNDNPRSEDPEIISQEIVKGFSSDAKYEVVLDRYLAIKRAIEIAEDNDTILLAGKGHEKYQIFAHKTIEFDDVKIAFELCNQKNHVSLV